MRNNEAKVEKPRMTVVVNDVMFKARYQRLDSTRLIDVLSAIFGMLANNVYRKMFTGVSHNLDVVKETELITKKQSKLSANKRRAMLDIFVRTFERVE